MQQQRKIGLEQWKEVGQNWAARGAADAGVREKGSCYSPKKKEKVFFSGDMGRASVCWVEGANYRQAFGNAKGILAVNS